MYSYAILTMGKTVDIKNGAGLNLHPAPPAHTILFIKTAGIKRSAKIFFRRDLAPLIKDCPGMYRKLDTEGYYFEDLVKIATEYNSCELLLPNAEYCAKKNAGLATGPHTNLYIRTDKAKAVSRQQMFFKTVPVYKIQIIKNMF